jgi:hypothetical protein
MTGKVLGFKGGEIKCREMGRDRTDPWEAT